MEKQFKYGPLVYNTNQSEEDEGNYFWNGSPPVGYDESGIPIDANGNQCLSINSPLHPAFDPAETVFSEVLQSRIPTINCFRKWFDENFLIISDDQIKRYIIKWWRNKAARDNYHSYLNVLHNYSSVEEIMEAVWPDETTS